MRIKKVIGWFIRQIPDRFFDALSGTECAEMDGIVYEHMLKNTEQKAALPVAGQERRKRNY